MRCRIHVAENRGRPQPGERVRRGNEGEGGHDHLPFEIEQLGRQRKSGRSVAHGDAVAHAESLGDALFELTNEWPVVREPKPIGGAGDAREEGLSISNHRPAYMKRPVEQWPPSEDRKLSTI